jgi:type IV fimbrial biogenesis protein FimT
MDRQHTERWHSGFTLVELMIVLAVVAVIALIAAPSMRSLIQMQRLRSINAQLVTDMQFARNEAVSRNVLLRVSFGANSGMTCYTLFTSPSSATRCDCTQAPGAACVAPRVEVRTVQVPTNLEVKVSPPARQAGAFAFDPTSGGIYSIPTDDVSAPMDAFAIDTYLDNARKLRTVLNRAGRPTVCAPAGSTLSEPACP